MNNRKTLIEVISNPANGIITALNNYDVPWKNNDYYVPDDMDYIINHSSTKLISRMVNILLNNDGVLTQNALGILANVIYKMYSRKWSKLYATFTLEYNPIENYDMTERMTNDQTQRLYNSQNQRTANLTHGHTGTDTTTHNTQNQRTANLQNVLEDEIQGFNSSDYQPSNKTTENNTGTDTVNNTGTDSVGFNSQLTETGTDTNAHTGTDTETRNYLLKRSGNIGVTTSQQMIESERELWEYDFIHIVYRDIDAIMTIDYYKGDDF